MSAPKSFTKKGVRTSAQKFPSLSLYLCIKIICMQHKKKITKENAKSCKLNLYFSTVAINPGTGLIFYSRTIKQYGLTLEMN